MSNLPPDGPRAAPTLTLKLGRLLEAQATGGAVWVLPLVLVLAFALGVVGVVLRLT